MTSAAQKKKGQGYEHQYVNAQGSEVKTRDEAFARQRDVSPQALAVTAKMRLNNGALTFDMEVTYNPNTYPHVVTGGQITSGICGAPWNITGGSIGPQLRLDGQRPGGPGNCASTITIIGQFQVPLSYRGTYGFNGQSSTFNHTTQVMC
ncbi:hypothetical protein [Streptomyces sp. MST-110588]|uniref:hypothetical protein n=1 Tax=Streptomyces sp. MST-110588 TaxID=2833628 RepID=UPI001F5C21EC|nr:hypothetical protein [Streptomyces sp. MST-110588]UNO42739.1 hypothetical protein KGS77_28395 [Streptomyces sp. MST-110588]